MPVSAPTSAPGAPAGEPASTPGASAGKPAADPADASATAPAASAPAGSPAEARSARVGGWFVQAAALSNETAASQLSERLSKAGLTPFVERTEAAGTVLYRVRLGPFGTRDTAVKARGKLRAMGVDSNVVRVEQAQR